MDKIAKILITIIAITTLGSAAAYYLLYQQYLSSSPTLLYSISFSGNANLRRGNLLYTFTPTVLNRQGVELLDFRLTVTNLGNSNYIFHYVDFTPDVSVYFKGNQVSSLNKASVTDLLDYVRELGPGQSQTVGWTWGSDSFATSPLILGVYNVSANLGYDRSWETPGVPMRVYLRAQPLLVAALLLTVTILVLVIYLARHVRVQ